jgi:ribonuclease H2 subunit A
VLRDHLLRTWQFKEAIDASRNFGSGYPSDPTTRKWLQNNWDPVFGYPSVIRFSWKTTDNFLSDAVDVDWVGEDDDENTWQPQQKKIKRQPIKAPPKPPTRFRYFADRQLELVPDFD